MAKRKQEKGWIVPTVAIVGIVILEAIALLKGINGVLFTSVIGVIGGIAGYKIKSIRS